jgi:hypothetical protein
VRELTSGDGNLQIGFDQSVAPNEYFSECMAIVSTEKIEG